MSSKKIAIVSEEFTREVGGVQMWSSLIADWIEEDGLAEVKRIEFNKCKFFIWKLLLSTSILVMNIRTLKYIFPVFFVISHFKKTSIVVHGDDILYKNHIERIFLWFLLKLPRAKVYANSKYTSSKLESVWGISSEVCNPFIDSTYAGKKNSTSKKNRFISVGRLAKRKNHSSVIEALYLLKDEIGDYSYTIVGDGPEHAALQELVEHFDLSEKIKFSGRVSEEDKVFLLRNSDYLFLPSIELEDEASVEGFGMVFIEANSYGIPVLGGRSGGMPEAIQAGVTGEICNGSVDSIVEAVRRLLKNTYDKNYLISYSKRYHYKNQMEFYGGIL